MAKSNFLSVNGYLSLALCINKLDLINLVAFLIACFDISKPTILIFVKFLSQITKGFTTTNIKNFELLFKLNFLIILFATFVHLPAIYLYPP